MSGIIPIRTVDTIRTFSDLAVDLFGITCTLYVPSNLTALEPNDAYTAPTDIVYTKHTQVPVWVEWFAKDIVKLRKLGIFSENELPMTAWFKSEPEVVIQSYIKVESRFIPNKYDTDEFEIVDVILVNTYDSEVYRRYKIAPRRAK